MTDDIFADLPITRRPDHLIDRGIGFYIKHCEPFRGSLSTGKLLGNTYYVFIGKRLIYRLDCVTGAYSLDTTVTHGNDQRLINVIKKARGIHDTPLEKDIKRATEHA